MIDQDALIKILGAHHVVVDPAEVERRARCLIPEVHPPDVFVYPGSIEEVRAVLRLANEKGFSVWPCGKGKNWGYGSATPARAGGAVMVLERMNRILEVNEKLAYAVIEPGVTYRQLHAHLASRGVRLWTDCTDGPADGSVVGNALERGIGETPYGDHFENICGIEAVLADGTLVRTGGGPLEGNKTWNVHKWGVGPYLEGLFSQSNFGVVTKIGLWLMPTPERFASCLFELRREEDFPHLIDALRRLAFAGALRSKIHLINDVTTFGVVAKNPRDLLDGAPCLTEERRAALRKQFNIAPWTFAAGLYGSTGQVRAAKALIRRELAPLGRLWFIGDTLNRWIGRAVAFLKKRPPATAHRLSMLLFRKPLACAAALPEMHAIEQGRPSDYFVKHAYMKRHGAKPPDTDIDPARDGCGGIWAGPVVPLEGRAVAGLVDHCRALARRRQLDINFALMVSNPRSVILLTSLFYDKRDAEETQRVLALYNEIAETTQALGYQQYRTSTAFMGRIYRTAPEFQALAERLKTALDPRNILAPGKYGIDPK